ncbi:MAG: DegT/DnrJ/EryC1/StrS family aminotransferase [Pseudomonadota bacterium]
MTLQSSRIPIAGPWITEREGELAREAALHAWGADHYRFNRRFETMFAEYLGVAHAISLPSATAGLHLALAAQGVGPGDEVIVPAVTWIASVAPVIYVGADPVFVDIDPATWCLDPAAVEGAITPKTRAVIGVDLYGSVCDWPALHRLAEDHGIALIEDAAEALGSALDGRMAGAWGQVAAFSFHGSKTLATGEGGMIVTDDQRLAERIMVLRDHGRPPGDRFFQNTEVAFKYKMSAVQAALGIAQMERIEELVAQKRRIFGWYRDRLGGEQRLSLNAEPAGMRNSYWMTTIVTDPALGIDKFAMMEQLAARGIDSRPFFSSLDQIPAFADRPEAARFLPPDPAGAVPARYGVNLPSGHALSEADVDRVCRAVREILEGVA